MSVKNNGFLAAAALAAGVTVAAARPPLVESMLDNLTIKKMDAAEINDGTGRVIAFVTVTEGGVDVVRAVADTNGNLRLYADGSAVVALSKRSNLMPGAGVRIVRFTKVGSVGDPIASLKAKYKKAKVEAGASAAKVTDVTAKKSAALSLGWDTAIGTPENGEYLDILERHGALTEWADATAALKTSLGAALTAAGIDPLTVV